MQKTILVRETTEMRTSSDLDLIEWMALGNSDKKKSTDAFAEFHRRYAKSLYSTCNYICRLMPNRDEAAADISEDVLIKAYVYASSYNANRASIKTWLNGIAQNEFNDYYTEFRKNHPLPPEPETDESEPDLFIEDETPIDRSLINGAQLDLALNILSDLEKDVLMTHMRYKDIDNLDSQIPDAIMKDLCLAYKKKPHSIRKIKSRAIQKLRTFILKL